MWSTCHDLWDKEKNLSPRTPVGCSKHWAMRDWRTRGELGHIQGSCMTCILRTARVSNVEIIMSRGVLIKRVEFREDVRGTWKTVRNNDVAGFDCSGNKACFYLRFRFHRCAFNAKSYSATTRTAALGRRLSNHNVFWKQKILTFFFFFLETNQ